MLVILEGAEVGPVAFVDQVTVDGDFGLDHAKENFYEGFDAAGDEEGEE